MGSKENFGTGSHSVVRSFAPIISGVFSVTNPTGDEEIKAELVPPAWPVTTTTTTSTSTLSEGNVKTAHLDVRCRAETDTKEHVYIRYSGILTVDGTVAKAIRRESDSKSTRFENHSNWFTKVMIETSDQRLKWLETLFLVGQGRIQVDDDNDDNDAGGGSRTGAEYAIYKLC
ncbi:uncharacterized protein PV06_09146 [Exophiala oligosperma]|uniref:Uncharacterized protein n=1 Tax=Exophiala oligosperma TaxID=215243 RepID=A0A0D2DA83_9EURO|nr:uncharacterized protein PV06_09146 [Exophiala oligosperma]KIW39370.1 hypothetical protein PV06_09146 [Exophiala oligosperma]